MRWSLENLKTPIIFQLLIEYQYESVFWRPNSDIDGYWESAEKKNWWSCNRVEILHFSCTYGILPTVPSVSFLRFQRWRSRQASLLQLGRGSYRIIYTYHVCKHNIWYFARLRERFSDILIVLDQTIVLNLPFV